MMLMANQGDPWQAVTAPDAALRLCRLSYSKTGERSDQQQRSIFALTQTLQSQKPTM